ncbi:serine/threonine-protein kinase [Embleya sp. NBC_00896]|uniref:serine/threonine-protein kinase n=1 Tax=Embleya sp. NBC_00896 TaxID=2975961 RepID=UPI002F9106F6|nr:PQQ-binding-like beta-propeller repeat protein [Embleya sp. NBC_00896]
MRDLQADDPQQVGGYRLLARLGVGGMGRVYLGRSATGRAVAVKVIRADLLDDTAGAGEFRRRFAREVTAARSVDARFTAPVVDADPGADMPWLATVYIPGLSLADALGDYGAFPERGLGQLAGGLAVALDGIHAVGLVHRDLKPSNVLLSADGPHVIDFGIALVSGLSTLTATGLTVGTLGFMSPEQFDSGDVGPASDVFSYGAVLAYAATGRAPFGAGSLPVLLANIALREPDLDGVPAAYLDLLRACLDKDPARRPTAREALTLLPDADRARLRAPDPDWLPVRIAHRLLRAAGSALDAEVPIGAGPPVDVAPPVTEPRVPSTPPPVDRRGTSTIPWARTAIDPDPAPAVRPPTSWRPWSYPAGRRTLSPAALADGIVYVGSDDREILAVDVATGEPRWRFRLDGSIPVPPIVRDGVVYVTTNGKSVYAFDAVTGTGKWRVDRGRTIGVPLMGLAGGTLFTGAFPQQGLIALDAATGTNAWRLDLRGLPQGEPAFHGETLFAGVPGHLIAIDTMRRVERWKLRIGGMMAAPTPPTFAASTLYVASSRNRLHAVDAGTGTERWRADLATAPSRPVVADGTVYVVSRHVFLCAFDASTGAVRWRFQIGRSHLSPPAVADGVVYVCSDEHLYAVDAATGTERWRWRAGAKTHSPVTAGGVVCVCSADGRLSAIDATTGAAPNRPTG